MACSGYTRLPVADRAAKNFPSIVILPPRNGEGLKRFPPNLIHADPETASLSLRLSPVQRFEPLSPTSSQRFQFLPATGPLFASAPREHECQVRVTTIEGRGRTTVTIVNGLR